MVLLHALDTLSAATGWRLAVAHFNHRLRGAESDRDEAFVRREAVKRGLRCFTWSGDVGALARREGLSIEMAARRMRHAFLADAAREWRGRTVALAHHADDQVELFLLRLLRGAGPEGLSGMDWKEPSPADPAVHLARPLLGLSRDELRRLALEQGVRWREDASNARLGPLRNRVRHKLLPLLSQEFQPAIAEALLRTMDILGAESDFVRRAAEEWSSSRRRIAFSRLHTAVQRRVIQHQLLRMGISPDHGLIERLRLGPGKPVTIRPHWIVERTAAGRVSGCRPGSADFSSEPGETALDLRSGEGEVAFGGLRVCWEVRAGRRRGMPRFGPGREWFDADKVGATAMLRFWRPGDRFQPIGAGQPVKLQDLFVNRKIPRDQRHQLVVATTAAGEIFWVEGLRMAERFKLDKGTKRRLKWRWYGRQTRVAGGRRPC